jgi:hypothetical protein
VKINIVALKEEGIFGLNALLKVPPQFENIFAVRVSPFPFGRVDANVLAE